MRKIHTKKVKIIAEILDKNELLKEHLVIDVDRDVIDKFNKFLQEKLKEEATDEEDL